MNKSILLPAVLAFALLACNQDNKSGTNDKAPEQANISVLEGFWIDLDFCARSEQYGSVLGGMNYGHLPYAYAMTFSAAKPDSVQCFNGFESWMLPLSFNADTIELKGARPDKSVFLIYDSQGSKDITMFDPSPSGMQLDRFIKSKAGTKDGYTAFTAALNNSLFSGAFVPLGAKTKGPNVLFTPGGFIQNFPDFNRYQVCTGGDCFVSADPIDVVTFSNSKKENSAKMFGFKYSNQNDTLTILNLINENPEEKGAYKIGKPAYRFFRKKAN